MFEQLVAAGLAGALPNLVAGRGRRIVVKLGGSAMEQPAALESTLQDLVLLQILGQNPVLVHGGGKAIDRALAKAGIVTKKIDGRRVTDESALEIVVRVLSEDLAPSLARRINAFGGAARCYTRALAGDRVQSPDLGFVGEVTSVDWQLLDRAAATGEIPIIPSLIHGSGGSWLNVNADDAATAIASQWPAGHLVFLTDTAGILRDVSDPNSRIATIRPSEIEALISDGVVTGGMIPKARGCVAALNSAGLESVQIIDGGVPHSLLMKLLTGHCPGTEFIP